MSVSTTIQKQLAEVAEQSGMTVDDYATWLGGAMPHASGQDKMKIAAQIFRTGACPLQGHASIMVHKGSHNLALNYDGWVMAGRRDGITGINCEIIEKADEPWGVRATVMKGEEAYSRTEVIAENRAMGSRNSKAWQNMPLRMTQHRAIVSAIRCACSVNSMASVEELADAGFVRSDSVTPPPAVKAAEKEFDATATVKPKFKGTAKLKIKEAPDA